MGRLDLRFPTPLLGLDYIVNEDGFWLIDVNNSPGWTFFPGTPIGCADDRSQAIEIIRNLLSRNINFEYILSERFVQHGDIQSSSPVRRFKRVLRSISREHRSRVRVSIEGASERDGRTIFINRAASASRLPEAQTENRYYINLPLSKIVVRDKLRLHEELTKAFSGVVDSWDSPCASEGCFLVQKPRFGYGSIAVSRMKAGEFHSTRRKDGREPNGGYVYQKWYEPGKVRVDGFEYYFDLRILLFQGLVCEVILRRSAMPCNLGEFDWLTTTGSSVQLSENGAPSLVTCQIEEILDHARDVFFNVNNLVCARTETSQESEFEQPFSHWGWEV